MATDSTFVWDESFVSNMDMSSATTFAGSAYIATYGCAFMIVQSTGLSGNAKYASMCLSSTGTGTAMPIGVVQNTPTSGHAATVRLMGRSKLLASSSGTIAYGDFVSSTTWGAGISITTSGGRVLGIARSASTGAAGQLVEVDLTGGWPYVIGG